MSKVEIPGYRFVYIYPRSSSLLAFYVIVQNYADNRAAILELHPEDNIPTYERVKQLVADVTG